VGGEVDPHPPQLAIVQTLNQSTKLHSLKTLTVLHIVLYIYEVKMLLVFFNSKCPLDLEKSDEGQIWHDQ
jgi:hypothetical protein